MPSYNDPTPVTRLATRQVLRVLTAGGRTLDVSQVETGDVAGVEQQRREAQQWADSLGETAGVLIVSQRVETWEYQSETFTPR